jgi:hypothetical protein
MQTSDFGPAAEYAAWVSLDWADQEHAWALLPAGAQKIEQGTVDSAPEAMEEWAQQLAERFAGKRIAVALEQQRGAVVALLSKYAHLVLYPIHPSTLAHYRKSFYPSGAKSDPSDALLQLELLRNHGDRLTVLQPDTIETRKLQFLTEQRRKRVDDRTGYCNELSHWLKQVFPQALRWLGPLDKPMACDFLLRWPTLTDLRAARKPTVQQFWLDHGSRDEKRNEQRRAEIQSAVEATRDPALIEAGKAAIAGLVRMLQQLRAILAELERQIRETAEAHPDFALIASFPGAGEALAVSRERACEARAQGGHLEAGGLTLMMAVQDAKEGRGAGMIKWLTATLVLGGSFLIISGFEWVDQFAKQFTFSSGMPGSTFYLMTGISGAHVFAGLLMLTYITKKGISGKITKENNSGLRLFSLFWMFVIAMIVVLFPALYLM